MSRYPALSREDRAARRERIIAAYVAMKRGGSRAVAEAVGVSDCYVRQLVKEAGVSRRPGAPTQ
jgi:hypothetical protein